jgi:hypothetical protein
MSSHPAPAATTAPATPAGIESKEDTMIHTDALADAAYEAAIEDAIEDPRQYAAEYLATGRVAAPASVLRWVVLGRRLATRKGVRLVVEAADQAGAYAAARARFGAGVMLDSATAQA